MKSLLIIAIAIAVTGCSDARRASISAIGSPAHITCYSGGKTIYDGDSTGRIATVTQSDGWEFKDAADGKFVRVSGDCVIRN